MMPKPQTPWLKKAIAVLLVSLAATNSFAQLESEPSDHLSFKGIEIDGALEEFVSKLKKSGFKYIGTEDGIGLLTGDFAAYKECTIAVVSFDPTNVVSKVVVIFPELDDWPSLSSNYFNLKELLTIKYGPPSEVEESFDGYPPDDNNDKMFAVKFDRCRYISIFETPEGSIELSIDHNGVSSCYARLDYFDHINSQAVKQNAIDDL